MEETTESLESTKHNTSLHKNGLNGLLTNNTEDPSLAASSSTSSSETSKDLNRSCCRTQKRQLSNCSATPCTQAQKLLRLCPSQCEKTLSVCHTTLLGESLNLNCANDTAHNRDNLCQISEISYNAALCDKDTCNMCNVIVDNGKTSCNTCCIEHVNDLPFAVLVKIFRNLSLYDLLNRASLVCKHWLAVSQDSDLWRVINLKGLVKVDDVVLNRVTSFSDNVTLLDVTDSRLVTTQGLSTVLEKCATIQQLKLIRCQQLEQNVFDAIGKFCHQLRKVSLDGCCMVMDRDIAKIAEGCSSLEVLTLNQCPQISNDAILSVAKGCPKLIHLSMDQCKKVGDDCIPALVEGCPNLQELSCMSCNVSDVGVRYLAQLKGLRIVELSHTQVSGESIMYLVKCSPHLESLNLSLCTSINDQCIEFIARNAPVISHLYLVSCNLTDRALEVLASYCKTIRHVDVGWCQQITDVGVRNITSLCGTLRHLGLMRCDKVSVATTEQLVEAYPHINFSTMYLDWKRLLDRAEKAGLLLAEDVAKLP